MERVKRQENFSKEEIKKLIAEVIARRDTITKPISATLNREMKNLAWCLVAERVSQVSGKKRTTDEVRRKFAVEKSKLKKKMAARRREGMTDGGPLPLPLNEWEELLTEFIEEKTASGALGDVEVAGVAAEPSSGEEALATLAECAYGCARVANEPSSTSTASSTSTKVTSDETPSKKRRIRGKEQLVADTFWEKMIVVQEEHLAIARERLVIERERLMLERRSLALGERGLGILPDRWIAICPRY